MRTCNERTGGYEFGGSPFTGGDEYGGNEYNGGSIVSSLLNNNKMDALIEAAIVVYFILLSMSLWIWGSKDLESGKWAIAGIVICGFYFYTEYVNGRSFLSKYIPMLAPMGMQLGSPAAGMMPMGMSPSMGYAAQGVMPMGMSPSAGYPTGY